MVQGIETFKKVLIEAIDAGLLMLGEYGRDLIYFRLKDSYALTKDNIPDHLEIFIKFIREMFGHGAVAIEREIINILCKKLEIKLNEKKSYNLIEYLNEARKIFDEKFKSKKN
jgi:hypothetical protein